MSLPCSYASGSDIQEYLTKVTKEHNLDRDAHFNAKVIEAIWDEGNGNWNLKVQQGDNVIEDSCDVLINGSGVLNAWSWPEITGLRDFQGHLCHSADWQKGYDFAGKKVAVVGNGSSGIQIVPELAKVASQLTNFARSPTYVSAPFVEDLCKDPGSNPEYTQEEKDEFRRNPEKHKKYRKKLIHAFNHYYAALIEGSAPNLEAKRRTKELMEQRLKGHPELMKLTIPEWSLGCRRLTPGNGYLESFLKDHVDLVASNIVEITPKGILCADGKERHFDAIVCATGFDVSFRPRWLQVGRNGRILADEYAQDAKSYFSIATTGQPNHFIFNGPAGPVGHGSLSSAIDWEADYILKWIQKMAKEDIKSFDVKPEVQDDWNVWGDQLLKRTVWATPCRSWFKNGTVNGRISALYPGSILHFKDILQDIRGEDFDITYRSKNRWKFLGNGFTQREMEDGDLGYYLEH